MATAEIILPILGGYRDVTNPPSVSWTDVPYLLFSTPDDELLTWSFRIPDNYASGLKVKWQYSMVSATTGVVAIRSQVGASSVADSITSGGFDTLEASADVTVPGVAGNLAEISFSLTNIDSVAAGDHFAIRLGRENGTTGTNASGDMAVWAVSLQYTTT